MLKCTECGKVFFCILALLALSGPCDQNALAQTRQEAIDVKNLDGNTVFRLDLYGTGSDFYQEYDETGNLTGGLTSARNFTDLEIGALTRGLEYWAEVVMPHGSPVTPVIIRAGVDYRTEMNAGAYGIGDENGTYPYRILGTGTDPGIWPSSVPGDATEGFHSLMYFNNTWWGFDPNSQLIESVRSMEPIMIHEFGHAMGIESTTPAWAAALQGAPGNMTFNGTEAATVYGDGTARPVPMTHFSRYEDSHPGLQNGLMSHQMFRNYSGFMEAEMAALRDIGYKNIDLRNFFGRSVYTDGNTITNDNGFYKSNGLNGDTWLGYAVGTANESSHGLGLHIYGNNNTVLQRADLLSVGEAGGGIRVDGFSNTVIIGEGTRVYANGNGGTGLLAAFGTKHKIIHRGDIQANGEGIPDYAPAVGVRFDFGPAHFGTGEEYDSGRSYGYVLDSNLNEVALDGALVDQFDVTGSISGTDAAIYIASNAHVREINLMQGTVINGDIISMYTYNGLTTSLTFGKMADIDGKATAAADNTFNYAHTSGSIKGSFSLETWGGNTILGAGQYDCIDVQAGIVGQGTADSTLILPGHSRFVDLTVTAHGELSGADSSGVNTSVLDVTDTLENSGLIVDVATLMAENSLTNAGLLAEVEEIQTKNFLNTERGIVAGVNTIIMASDFTKEGTIGNHVYTGVNYQAGGPIFDKTTGAPITCRGKFVNQGGTIAVGNVEAIAGLINQPDAAGGITLTVDGNFESTSGTFIVGLGLRPNENEAFINVVNGNAVIMGGTVNIVPTDEMNYLSDKKFTLISVDQGHDPAKPYGLFIDPGAPLIAGEVSDPLFDDFFNVSLTNDGQSYDLSLTRTYTYSAGKTENQRAVGRYIDTATVYPAGDFRNVLLALKDTRLGAHTQSRPDLLNFVKAQMGGSIYGTETASSFRNTVMLHSTLANVLRRRVQPCRCSNQYNAYYTGKPAGLPTDNLWGMIYGHAGSSQFDGNTVGYRQGFSGIMAGFDQRNDRRQRSGFFLSVGDGSLSSELNDRALSKELLLGYYFRKDAGNTYMLVQAGFGTHRYDTRRSMVLGSVENATYMNRTARNEHSSFLFTGHFETGLKYRDGLFNFSPYVGLEYTGLLREGFTENSAGSLNLTADREDYYVVRPMFGLRFDSAPIRFQGGMASFYGNAAWMYEFEASERPTKFETRFTESGIFSEKTFTVYGNDPGKDYLQAGFGLNVDLSTNRRVFAGYDVYANNQQVLHSANLGFVLQR